MSGNTLNSILAEDKPWKEKFDSMKVTGKCNGHGCENDAKHWYGNSNQAHCGEQPCINHLNDEYQKLSDEIDEKYR